MWTRDCTHHGRAYTVVEKRKRSKKYGGAMGIGSSTSGRYHRIHLSLHGEPSCPKSDFCALNVPHHEPADKSASTSESKKVNTHAAQRRRTAASFSAKRRVPHITCTLVLRFCSRGRAARREQAPTASPAFERLRLRPDSHPQKIAPIVLVVANDIQTI